MSASERRKGVRFEQHVATVFRDVGFDCYRVPNSGGLRVHGDLAGTVPAHLECKNQAVLRLPLWLRQARDEAPLGVVPVVVFHIARQGDYAALPLDALATLLSNSETLIGLAPNTGRVLVSLRREGS